MASRRILLIDIEGTPREALAHLLISDGFEVEVASAGDAWARLEKFQPDTILYGADRSDADMREIVEQIEAASEGPRLIALGAAVQPTPESRMVAGRTALPRPVNLEELRRALRAS